MYASHLELYASACEIAMTPPWPPSMDARDVLCCLCKHAATLEKYMGGVRSVLDLLRCDLGSLGNTRTLVLGAKKV